MNHSAKLFKLNVRISTIGYILIYSIFIKPGFVDDIEILDLIWNSGRFSLTILFLSLFLLNHKNFSSIKYPLMIFLVTFVSTYLHHGLYRIVFRNWVPVIGLISWLDLHKKRIKEITHIFFYMGGLLIILNLMSIMCFPRGFWTRAGEVPVWILGQKQEFITCIFPTVFLGIINLQLGYRNKKYFCLVLFCIACSLAYARPVGLIFCLTIMSILLIIEKVTRRTVGMKILAFGNLIGELLAICIAFTYINLTQLQNFLSGIMSNGANKFLTMRARFQMWEYAVEALIKNPILGLGQVTENTWYQTSNLSFYHTIVHNLPLDIGLAGGGIALSFFVCWNVMIVRKLQKTWSIQISRCIGIAVFAFNIICITECPYQPMVFVVYAYAMWIEYFGSTVLLVEKGSLNN